LIHNFHIRHYNDAGNEYGKPPKAATDGGIAIPLAVTGPPPVSTTSTKIVDGIAKLVLDAFAADTSKVAGVVGAIALDVAAETTAFTVASPVSVGTAAKLADAEATNAIAVEGGAPVTVAGIAVPDAVVRTEITNRPPVTAGTLALVDAEEMGATARAEVAPPNIGGGT
jgi:hypothetical protein